MQPVSTRSHLGAGCLLTRPDVFSSRAEMLGRGEIGHVQVLVIPPGSPARFEEAIQVFEPYRGMIRIHAPHHLHHINPCAPELYTPDTSGSVQEYYDTMMSMTAEAADRTGSSIIVLHAGRYRRGTREEAISRFHDFLDRYPDRRYILETLPDLTPGPRFLGITPKELHLLGGERIRGYCADFPHLWCTSVRHLCPYPAILASLQTLPVVFSHISGTEGPHTYRQHLLFDDPANRFGPGLIRAAMESLPGCEVSLELAVDDPAVIRNQLSFLTPG